MLRLTQNDKSHMAEYIVDQQRTRKGDRKYFDLQVKEIDRQLRMEPESAVIKGRNGTIDEATAWLPEAELPLQSQTLEATDADVMRMILPRSGPFFEAHVALTDEWLDKVDFQSLITGDENDVPTKLNQDNANKLVYGLLNHYHNQYDFRGHLGLITGESIKYGMGIGRARVANKRVFLHSTKGVMKKEMDIPILVPRSIKNVFLDNSEVFMMNEGHIVSPGHIYHKKMKLKDVQLASQKGNADTNDMINGGWIKNAVRGLEEDDHGDVEFLEWEGDMVVPRKTTGSLYLPNAVITLVIGMSDKKSEARIIRIRKNKYPFSSHIEFPYHKEHIDSPYGSSPLMKGRPVAASAVYALNRLLEASAYDAQPAARYDKDDEQPKLFPGAMVGTESEIDILDIGNPQALFAVYSGFLQQYEDVSGKNRPSLGAQTVSHTTAFAKDAELQRGQSRTVDFVDDTLDGPIERWLDIEYELAKDVMKGDVTFLIPQYGGYVTLNKSMLPKEVGFSAYGSGGPAEEAQKKQLRQQSLQQAVQLDTMKMQQQLQLGQPPTPTVDLEAAIRETLADGGWTDVDAITRSEEAATGTQGQPGVEGSLEPNPGLQTALVQAGAFGNR